MQKFIVVAHPNVVLALGIYEVETTSLNTKLVTAPLGWSLWARQCTQRAKEKFTPLARSTFFMGSRTLGTPDGPCTPQLRALVPEGIPGMELESFMRV